MFDMLQLVGGLRTQCATLLALLFLECCQSLRQAEACRTLRAEATVLMRSLRVIEQNQAGEVYTGFELLPVK